MYMDVFIQKRTKTVVYTATFLAVIGADLMKHLNYLNLNPYTSTYIVGTTHCAEIYESSRNRLSKLTAILDRSHN
uniref:Uncharacterized protein n=1 Tax=Glossina brevipalpis TaxID=37001 RepID=A0A1A9X5B4_9MUSC